MEKEFFDVFPNLKLKQELKELLEDVIVTKVSCNAAKTRIRVYIRSDRWIHKKHIFDLEDQIERQCFPGLTLNVTVIERFFLSKQYTPANFLDTYRSSMELELKNYNMLEHNLFKRAEIVFPQDNTLHMTLPDSVIAREKSEILVEYLQKIFCERCGMNLKVELEYVETEESKYRKNAAIQIRQEVENVLKHAKISGKEEGAQESSAGGAAEEKKTKKAGASPEKSEKKQELSREKKTFEKKGKWGDRGGFRKDPNPDVVYGRDFDGEVTALEAITGEVGEVIVRGQVMEVEAREIRNEKTILIFPITDFTDSITIKLFLRNEQVPEITEAVKKGAFLKLKGVTTIDRFDSELTIGSINGIKKIGDFRNPRTDTSPQKRVELHCHTKMSDMDGVTDAKALVKRAYEWGHKAIAITDHGVVQSFPEANHCFDAWGGCVPKDSDFKVLYGMEAYIVDDLKGMVTNAKGQRLDGRFVVFDIETTGFSPLTCKIIEIGAVLVENGQITDRFSTFVNPEVPIPFRIEQLTSINDSMVMDAPTIEKVLPEFLEFCQGATMVAHNADFDMSFIIENCNRLGIPNDFTYADTVGMARFLLPALNRFKLDTVAKAVGVSLDHHHRAVDDAECTARIFEKFVEMLAEREIFDVNELNEKGAVSADTIRKLPTYHAVIFMRNETGRINLYKLVSQSHLKYYNRRPRVPKSVFEAHREGLIIGSACEAGELYQALLRNAPDTEIARLVKFYDYLEIQPLGNNRFMIADEKNDMVNSDEDLIDLNKKIVKLGEQFKKPVVATCDVHFMDPQDEVYRRIIMAGNGFSDADNQAPLFLRTTEEMLEEFSYLGSEKAEEVVITNTNKIADMIEKLSPIHPDKFPPIIENSDQNLKDICFNKAHEMYGDPLPGIVEERLNKELNSIISNGYAVMYIIAQKLVWKSNDDGYLVGSRGSVGSSLAATMAGITEVNPLPPHYLCPNPECKYSDFDSPEIKEFAGMAGCDMPDKICPKCGTRMNKEGFDIPFETFLGFKGDKEPDIDLNFSGEYQANAHKYTEVIFGKGQTFKAGTIGTLAEKTAFGYVKKYFEERDQHKRYCEINRIVQGCTGVRRTTGQHPGGIIVLPKGEEIEKFTPVQHPANDVNSDIVTTHFDYHSIDGNLLKLDILGHDDPTMIRMLEDLTDISARTVPLDDKSVMSLFASTEALKIKPEDIGGCKLGCLGIPEFGTDFAMQMLIDTKPKYFSDLVRIAGLSHGTDVWLGNAQTLIEEGKATISTAICTRDDIMIYLIGKGVESGLSFTIMESVRKGKGLRDEWITVMKEHGVPDWYIWSCKKIKYMFPKAHAAAYVMMAYRIAWYKVFQPLAYYAAYFSIRATAFSYELMCMGRDRLEYYMAEIRKKGDQASKKEQDTLKDMRVVQEMYARGFDFLPIDLYTAKAHRFQIIGEKLMPALDTIEGLGDKAADAVVEAAKDGKFLSKDDFRDRTKVSKTVIDLMDDLGMFGDIPQSNQMSLFDFTKNAM
ncbi:PolC-type DNA polymerase III [Ruminococcus sp. 5_1_39BFAA]|uniref:PolC-type DNA polymerase III n=1 Tax=Ruminococcus sp. 5_1_39BFAA TaxID=457412 RepID=UPI003565E966